MKVKLKPVRAYELLGPDGKVVAMLTTAASWEGMLKLVTDSGAALIIERPEGLQQAMAEARSVFGGDGVIECDVHKGSPSLIAELIGLGAPAP